MANKYWVGGGSSTNWDATGNTNWSDTDGGSNNATIPTTGDSVFFKSSANCNLNVGSADLNSIDMTGYTGVMACSSGNNVTIAPASGTVNAILVGTSFTNGQLRLYPAGGATINFTPPSTSSWEVQICYSTSGTVSLQASLICGQFTHYDGTFNSNGNTITCSQLYATSGPTINAANSTITITGTQAFAWYIQSGCSIDLNGTTINFQSDNSRFYSADKIYNIVNFLGDDQTIFGSGTYSYFNVNNAGQATGLIFTSGTTQTVTNFSTNGSVGNLAKILSTSSGNPFYLVKSGMGTISEDYMSIKDCSASPANTWYAGTHSDNVSGNSGWIFSDPPSPLRARCGLPVWHKP